MDGTVTRLSVDDEDFLVSSIIDRCPRPTMIRELVQNAIEAAIQTREGAKLITIDTVKVFGARKLRIWNTGPGMNADELYRMCDLSASINKTKSLTGNFGIGAKVATLPSNTLGARYWSCKKGVVHEVILGKRNGVYGRVWQEAVRKSGQEFTDIVDVTAQAGADGHDTTYDWTEVVLLGNRPDQDTALCPFDDSPTVDRYWLPEALYRRFLRLPEGITLQISADLHWNEGVQTFQTVLARAATSFGRYEAATGPDGIVIHYFYDPVHPERSWDNLSCEGAMQNSKSFIALAYKDEIYEVIVGAPWAFEAPTYGFPVLGRHFSVIVELPTNYELLGDMYRQFLRYAKGEQGPISVHDFSQMVFDHRPDWVIDILSKAAGASSVSRSVHEELHTLAVNLNLIGRDSGVDGAGFDIVLLRDPVEIDSRWLLGRAASYTSASRELFINTTYDSIVQTVAKLSEEVGVFSGTAEEELITTIVETEVTLRVARALVYGLSKVSQPSLWHPGHIEKAIAPEALSIVADEVSDTVHGMRRKVRKALNIV